MRSKLRLILVAIVLLALALSAGPAAAGTYTVRQCDHAAGNGFHDFQWQAAGTPALIAHSGSGCSEFGLAARNGAVGTEQTYPSGGYGGWFAYAPIGTVITRFSGAFGTLVGCCVNGLAPYAEASGPSGRAYLFQGDLGNDSWYGPSSLRGPVGRGWDASTSGFTAKSVGFYVRCGPGFSCFQQRTGDFRVRGRSFDFTLRDDVAPAVAPLGGTLTSGGWLRGTRTLSFSSGDVGGGVAGVSAAFDSGTVLPSASGCTTVAGRYARLQPCPLGRSGTWTVDTSKLPDGARTVTVRATDAGGATGQQTRTVLVDNSPPAAPLGFGVVGGHGWRRSNGFALSWANPAGQHAPIVRARLRACLVGGSRCIDLERSAESPTAAGPIALPRAGEWDVRGWLEDAAGNSDAALAAPPQRLRFDPDPPVLRFLPTAAGAPTRLVVETQDRSGVVGGGLALRRLDRRGRLDQSGWTSLPTALQGHRLVAEIDDAGLRGDFVVRARAVDAAGNHASVDSGVRTLPIRTATRLEAAFARRGGRHTVMRARHGSLVAVRGRLTAATGSPLAARPVTVELVSRDRAVKLPTARTDSAGRVTLLMRARRSAVVRLTFAGDRSALPSTSRLALHVPAPVTLAANQRRLPGGGRIVLRGRIRGGALPRRGKLVEIQAHFRGRWRTISAVRAGRSGRYRFAYVFQPSGREVTYRLRARVAAEARYPFAAGASKPVRVTVRPR